MFLKATVAMFVEYHYHCHVEVIDHQLGDKFSPYARTSQGAAVTIISLGRFFFLTSLACPWKNTPSKAVTSKIRTRNSGTTQICGRACVKSRGDDKLDNSFVRYPLADENHKLEYYMQQAGSHPTESLQPKPDIALSSWNTYPGFSFEPYGLSEKSISDDDYEVWSAPYFASDPRDPAVEQSPKRTIQRHSDQAIEPPTSGVISKPDWRWKPARPLGAALDFLEKLSRKLH
ncbi:hypothetical protein GGU10DRAFT_334137 [Lentinula aff. detonsa]|uniref:Uncharacterized protein n=1 Tax=Lentinula aff. detonsa TaxID=2804958 RepID=A0AA38KPA7_9AGAR|nr:hypothetical protein GGU10DRAFT_334137 [Lentinula aff. detonsa]